MAVLLFAAQTEFPIMLSTQDKGVTVDLGDTVWFVEYYEGINQIL